MVHKPKHKVHSFRGRLGDSGQDEINLERQNVNLAYRITKFQLCLTIPGTSDNLQVLQIFKEKQTGTFLTSIDFDNPDLLGAGYIADGVGNADTPDHPPTIFDNILFSRNIYITNKSVSGSNTANWYIEIEEVPVSPSTLMQIKLGTARKLIGAKMGG